MVRIVGKAMAGRRAARSALEFLEKGARIAVLTRHKGRYMVADLIEVDYPTVPAGQTLPASVKAAAVRDALRARGWRLDKTTLVLPKNVVTLRLVVLPSTEDAEIAEMARFEAQKYIPFNVERHIIAHAVLAKYGVEGSSTLIVAVDRAALEEPLAICREAGIELAAVRVSSLALVEALHLAAPAALGDSTFALVNIGWSAVDITVVSRGVVRLTRSGTMGVSKIASVLTHGLGQAETLTRDRLATLDALAPEGYFDHRAPAVRRRQPTSFVVDDFDHDERAEAAAKAAVGARTEVPAGQSEASAEAQAGPVAEVARWLSRLVQEIQRTHDFATRELECPKLESVYVAGVGASISNIEAYLEQHMGCPVQSIEPPASLDFAAAADGDLREAWGEFAVTIGAAVGEALPLLSLLPPEYTETLARRKRHRVLVTTAILVALLIAVSGAYAVRWRIDQNRQLEYYQQVNEKLAPRYRELRDKQRRIKIVREIVQDQLSAGAVLEKIADIDLIAQTPPRVTLLEYKYERGSGLELMGHTYTYQDLDSFVDVLNKTGCFKLIERMEQKPIKLPRREPELRQFRLKCIFSEAARR